MDRKSLPSLTPPPPPFQSADAGSNLSNNVSPNVFLIIIILAVIFFISGLLHLLVRFFVKPSTRHPDEFDNVTALQGQLQQLFTLHDSGVDQSFIDTLPVFTYKSIVGVKNPFDCAICLCEFEDDDNLRLLPKCSHAFHMGCIDTWLLSHSTCPLCRGNLVFDYNPNTCCSPIVLVLESGSGESSREIVDDPTIQRVSSDVYRDEESEFDHLHSGQNEVKEEENKEKVVIVNKQTDKHTQLYSTRIVGSVEDEMKASLTSVSWDKETATRETSGSEKVVTVKLGKFKNVDGGGEDGDEKSKIDGRRCFSMGSFEYVMDDNASLHVQIRTRITKQAYNKSNLPITPSHRPAMSECGGESRRDFKGIEAFRGVSGGSIRGESFSVSKIRLTGKKEKPKSPLAVAAAIEPPPAERVSLQFFLHQNVTGDESDASKVGCNDLEMPSCNNLDSQAASNPPSLAKRSLIWLMCRQKNKDVHSSLSINV